MHIPVELPPCDCMPQYLAVLHIKSHPAPPSLSSLYTASVWQPSTLHFQRPMPAVAHYILRAQSIFKKKSCTKNKAICTMVKFDSRQSPASPSMPPNTPFWMLPKKGLFKHSFSKSKYVYRDRALPQSNSTGSSGKHCIVVAGKSIHMPKCIFFLH